MIFLKNKIKNQKLVKKKVITLKFYKKPSFSWKQKNFLKGLKYNRLSEFEKNYIFKKYFAYKYHKVVADKILSGPIINFNKVSTDQQLLYYMLWKYRFLKRITYGLYIKRRISRLQLWKKRISIAANWRRLKKMKLFQWFRFKYNNLKYYLYLSSKTIKRHRFKNKKKKLRQKSKKKLLTFIWYFKHLHSLSSGLFSAEDRKKERRIRASLMNNCSGEFFLRKSRYSKKNVRSLYFKYRSLISFLNKQEYLKQILFVRRYYEKILNEKKEWIWRLEKIKGKRYFHQKICARFFFKKFFLVSSLKISHFRKSIWWKRQSLSKMLNFLEFHKGALFKSFGWVKNYKSYKNIIKRKACFIVSNKNFLITKKFLNKKVVYKLPSLYGLKKQFGKFSKLIKKKTNDFLSQNVLKNKKKVYSLLLSQNPFFLKNKYKKDLVFVVKKNKLKAFKVEHKKRFFLYHRSFNLKTGFNLRFYNIRFKKFNKNIKYAFKNFFKNSSSYLKDKWPQKYHKIDLQSVILLLKINRSPIWQKIKIKEMGIFKIVPRALLHINIKNYKKLRNWYSFLDETRFTATKKSNWPENLGKRGSRKWCFIGPGIRYIMKKKYKLLDFKKSTNLRFTGWRRIRYIKKAKQYRKYLDFYRIYVSRKPQRAFLFSHLRRPPNLIYKYWGRFLFKKLNKILNYGQRCWINKWWGFTRESNQWNIEKEKEPRLLPLFFLRMYLMCKERERLLFGSTLYNKKKIKNIKKIFLICNKIFFFNLKLLKKRFIFLFFFLLRIFFLLKNVLLKAQKFIFNTLLILLFYVSKNTLKN